MKISTRLAPLPLLTGLVLLASTAAHAQADAQADAVNATRAALIVAEQAAKAKDLKPYQASAIERRVAALQNVLAEQPSGLYPLFASVYSGGGFTLGAGYRQFYGDRTHADVKGLYSLAGYKLVEVSTDSWGHAQGRLDLHARVGWRDATEVAFHGVGLDSPEDLTNFRMKQAYVGGDAVIRPGGFTVFGAGLTSEAFTLQGGTGRTPSIEEVHTPESAPGLNADPTYLHATATAGIDSRPSAGYARRGGLYAVTYHNYADQDDTYSFDRLDGDVVQHIPILRENWVISLHGQLQTTLDDNDIVPHFLLPSLGSGSTLRGYPSWRFRDRHSLLMSAEWRWIPSRVGLDMALFYDAGKVGARFDDLSLKGLKSDVGIGIRLHSPLVTPLRIELAKGSEGMRLVFAGSAAF
ncbi:BamA/TamA family outer membrane protein [soil metagenome]